MEYTAPSPAPDALGAYQNRLAHIQLLGAEAEQRLARRSRRGDQRARRAMIVGNLRLTLSMARRYINRGLPLEDLIEEANIGLMRAVEKFDPDRGYRFSTYATWWIRQCVERAIMNHSRTVRLPVHVIKEINLCLQARERLRVCLGRTPTAGEVAAETGRSPAHVRRLMRWYESDQGQDFAPDVDMLHGADEVREDPAWLEHEETLRERLGRWVGQLEPRQRDVIVRRFGFHGHDCGTLEQIGHQIGLTRERVRQIQLEALARLRELAEAHGLDARSLTPPPD